MIRENGLATYSLRSAGALFFLAALVTAISLACRRGGDTVAPAGTPVFQPGAVATQLARPTQEWKPGAEEPRDPGVVLPSEPVDDQVSPEPVLTQPSEHDQYFLQARLFDEHNLDVRQAITYTNRTETSLEEIWLVVEANRQEGVFILQEITWNGMVIQSSGPEGGAWQIGLPSELKPGEQGILAITYQLSLKATGGVLGYSRRQVNFGDWYVRIPPYQAGKGWLVHNPGAAGEHNVYDMADFHIQLDLGDAGEGLVVAASAPGQACGTLTCYTMPDSRGFAWSASPEYQVLEAVENSILLQQYVFPEHASAGAAALEVARDAIRIFEQKFGKYPYPALAMVEAGFFDGMEYPGMFFLGEEYYTNYGGTPGGYLTALTAHEIAHQWWFALVGNDQALEPWLDEALATYSELIYYQAQHPDLVEWWWNFRVGRFQPSGDVGSSIYDHAGFRPYVNAVYLRGAQFLQELRLVMGDEAFEDFLGVYFSTYQGRMASGKDFFSIAEQFAGEEELQAIRGSYFAP